MTFKNATCIYCNNSISTPKGDHIPPKSFFKRPRHFALKQVPCCLDCNHEFSKYLDDEIRDFIVLLEQNQAHQTVNNELIQTVFRSWDNAKDNGKRKKFIREFIDVGVMQRNALIHTPIQPNEITDEELDILEMPILLNQDHHKFCGRMSRALFFIDYDKRFTGNFYHRTRFREQLIGNEINDLNLIKTLKKYSTLGEDEDFRWITYWDGVDKMIVCWMQFYKGTEIIVYFGGDNIV